MEPTDISRVVIIDDEPPVRSVLREILQNKFPSIQVVSEAGNVPEAVREIHKQNPDLLFLDIEMPGYSGLQLPEFFNQNEINFDIIFVTAYSEFAIQAFKIAAFDYLLKPVNTEDLEQTLERYFQTKKKEKITERLSLLKQSYQPEALITQLAISSLHGIDFIDLKNIIAFEASGAYTVIVLTDGQLVASKPIGEFENILQYHRFFFRPHRSYLINLHFVKKLSTREGDMIIMNNNMQVPLSRYKKKEFDDIISSYKV
jgi:two-component system LytT family response regulator